MRSSSNNIPLALYAAVVLTVGRRASAGTSPLGSRPNRITEELNHGYRLHHHHLRVLPAHLGLRSPLREGLAMSSLLILGGVLAVLLLAYLSFALLYPDKLS